jgi:diguanylate cyclase (GGDEF)-like protein
VALMTVVAATGASLLSLHRLAGSGEAPAEVSGGIFTYVLIAVVVRLLRDVAHASVERARRGEVTDPLTGLANRRGFERSGAESWARRAQERKPLVLLLVDVDHFKRVNDTLGHAAGDELLRKVATLLQSTLREGDLAFRLGGEEFAVLVRALPGEAAALGERLRARVEETLPVTVSIGAVEATPGSELDVTARLWRIVDQADGGLYEAKRGGRNRVVEVAADVPA